MTGLSVAGDAKRVRESTVVRHWLRTECEAAAAGRSAGPVVETGADDALPDPEAVPSLSDREALDALLAAKPGAARFLAVEGPVAWYRTAVGGDRFGRLRLVECPEGTLWRVLAPDRSPVTAARTILRGDPDALAAESGVDVPQILDVRDSLDAGRRPAAALVVRTRRGRAPWTVVDGNHRAVARATALVGGRLTESDVVGDAAESKAGGGAADRDGSAFAPQPVYVGVRPNPVVRPLRERLGGLVRRLLGRGLEPP